MARRYRIIVESENPEFQDEDLNGMEADGFLLLTMKDGKPDVVVLHGMSINDLSEFFVLDDECVSILRQASAIAEGRRRAKEIWLEGKKSQMTSEIAKKLAGKFAGMRILDEEP